MRIFIKINLLKLDAACFLFSARQIRRKIKFSRFPRSGFGEKSSFLAFCAADSAKNRVVLPRQTKNPSFEDGFLLISCHYARKTARAHRAGLDDIGQFQSHLNKCRRRPTSQCPRAPSSCPCSECRRGSRRRLPQVRQSWSGPPSRSRCWRALCSR